MGRSRGARPRAPRRAVSPGGLPPPQAAPPRAPPAWRRALRGCLFFICRGIVASILVFLCFGVTQAKDGPFSRPHPGNSPLCPCASTCQFCPECSPHVALPGACPVPQPRRPGPCQSRRVRGGSWKSLLSRDRPIPLLLALTRALLLPLLPLHPGGSLYTARYPAARHRGARRVPPAMSPPVSGPQPPHWGVPAALGPHCRASLGQLLSCPLSHPPVLSPALSLIPSPCPIPAPHPVLLSRPLSSCPIPFPHPPILSLCPVPGPVPHPITLSRLLLSHPLSCPVPRPIPAPHPIPLSCPPIRPLSCPLPRPVPGPPSASGCLGLRPRWGAAPGGTWSVFPRSWSFSNRCLFLCGWAHVP